MGHLTELSWFENKKNDCVLDGYKEKTCFKRKCLKQRVVFKTNVYAYVYTVQTAILRVTFFVSKYLYGRVFEMKRHFDVFL